MNDGRESDRGGRYSRREFRVARSALSWTSGLLLAMAALGQAQPTYPVFGPPIYSPFGIRPVLQVPAVDMPQVSANTTFGYPLTPNTWNTSNSYVAPHPSGSYYYPYTQIPTAQVNQGDRIAMQENRATIIRNGMIIGMLRRQRRQLYWESNLAERQLNDDRLLRKWQYQREWANASAPYRKASQKGKAAPPAPAPVKKDPPVEAKQPNDPAVPSPPRAQ